MRILATIFFCLATPAAADCVVLLHGLSRTEVSMRALGEALEYHGYHVVNEGYPSNDAPIEELVEHVGAAVSACGEARVHMVTHSMGGILARAWLRDNRPADMGRVVMLAPPNHGSEIVDNMAELDAFPAIRDVLDFLQGPAARELGTGMDSVPSRLPPVDFELGVIAGNRAINPLGPFLIEGENDGAVSVESTRVEGMADHIVLPVTHTMMMINPLVMAQVLEFLRNGVFDHGITLGAALRKLASP